MPGHEARLFVLHAGLRPGGLCEAKESPVLPDPHGVLHLEVFEDAEGLGSGEATIEADDDPGFREGDPQSGHHPAKDPESDPPRRAMPGRSRARKRYWSGSSSMERKPRSGRKQ